MKKETRLDLSISKETVMKTPQEWLKQAVYDIETAEFNYQGKRYFHAIFLCHLAIEKALKGLYEKELMKLPPKTHNLLLLVEQAKIAVPRDYYDYLSMLNGIAVTTRYPDSLMQMEKSFDEPGTYDIIARGKVVLEWIEEQFKKP
jgi:HEPN domain-containing protein